MDLEYEVDSLDKVPAAFRECYTVKDGKAHLNIKGGKFAEFRDSNITLMKKVADLETRFKDIDPDKVRTDAVRLAELEKGTPEQQQRITDLEAKFNAEQAAHAATKAAVTAATEKANAGRVRDLIKSKFREVGGRPNAEDMAADALSAQFTLGDDGTLKAKDNLFSTDRPGEPLTLGEAMTRMAKAQEFLFFPSTGSGSRGSGRGFSGGGSGDNRPVLKNPTPAQLGQYAKEIATGKMRVHHDE